MKRIDRITLKTLARGAILGCTLLAGCGGRQDSAQPASTGGGGQSDAAGPGTATGGTSVGGWGGAAAAEVEDADAPDADISVGDASRQSPVNHRSGDSPCASAP